jgi:phospholipase/carboxylesterase
MMALHVGMRRKQKIGAVVSYSGLLAGAENAAAEAVTRPPVMLAHGELDEVIPFGALAMSREALGAAGFEVQWHAAPNIGHGIDQEGLRLGGRFLRDMIARPKA